MVELGIFWENVPCLGSTEYTESPNRLREVRNVSEFWGWKNVENSRSFQGLMLFEVVYDRRPWGKMVAELWEPSWKPWNRRKVKCCFRLAWLAAWRISYSHTSVPDRIEPLPEASEESPENIILSIQIFNFSIYKLYIF